MGMVSVTLARNKLRGLIMCAVGLAMLVGGILGFTLQIKPSLMVLASSTGTVLLLVGTVYQTLTPRRLIRPPEEGEE